MDDDNLELLGQAHLHKKNIDALSKQVRILRDRDDASRTTGLPTVDVVASGQASAAPDRCSVSIVVNSAKPDSDAARNSVERRLAYILKILQNNGVNTEEEQELLLIRELQRTADGKYQYIALLRAEFNDHSSMQHVVNTFTEKLDAASVRISEPRFFASASLRETIRQRATLAALANAKRKASECCQCVGAQLGAVVHIREEYTSETVDLQTQEKTGKNEIQSEDGYGRTPSANLASNKSTGWLERYEAAYTSSQVRLFATFEMRPATRSLS